MTKTESEYYKSLLGSGFIDIDFIKENSCINIEKNTASSVDFDLCTVKSLNQAFEIYNSIDGEIDFKKLKNMFYNKIKEEYIDSEKDFEKVFMALIWFIKNYHDKIETEERGFAYSIEDDIEYFIPQNYRKQSQAQSMLNMFLEEYTKGENPTTGST